jgi:transcriptional regulator with XRE-family HTH domain
MSQLSENLNERRKALGLTYEDVHAKLEENGVIVSISTVGHWFNGTREPRSMKNLRALCDALETSIHSVLGEDFTYPQSKPEQLLLNKFRLMTAEQQSAYLLLAESMTPNTKGKE